MVNNKSTKRLTKKELRELLISAKKKADKMPKEKGSFRLEVVCTEEDIN
ncbi:16338_t:CDS:1, partial [Racocetra persica]